MSQPDVQIPYRLSHHQPETSMNERDTIDGRHCVERLTQQCNNALLLIHDSVNLVGEAQTMRLVAVAMCERADASEPADASDANTLRVLADKQRSLAAMRAVVEAADDSVTSGHAFEMVRNFAAAYDYDPGGFDVAEGEVRAIREAFPLDDDDEGDPTLDAMFSWFTAALQRRVRMGVEVRGLVDAARRMATAWWSVR